MGAYASTVLRPSRRCGFQHALAYLLCACYALNPLSPALNCFAQDVPHNPNSLMSDPAVAQAAAQALGEQMGNTPAGQIGIAPLTQRSASSLMGDPAVIAAAAQSLGERVGAGPVAGAVQSLAPAAPAPSGNLNNRVTDQDVMRAAAQGMGEPMDTSPAPGLISSQVAADPIVPETIMAAPRTEDPVRIEPVAQAGPVVPAPEDTVPPSSGTPCKNQDQAAPVVARGTDLHPAVEPPPPLEIISGSAAAQSAHPYEGIPLPTIINLEPRSSEEPPTLAQTGAANSPGACASPCPTVTVFGLSPGIPRVETQLAHGRDPVAPPQPTNTPPAAATATAATTNPASPPTGATSSVSAEARPTAPAVPVQAVEASPPQTAVTPVEAVSATRPPAPIVVAAAPPSPDVSPPATEATPAAPAAVAQAVTPPAPRAEEKERVVVAGHSDAPTVVVKIEQGDRHSEGTEATSNQHFLLQMAVVQLISLLVALFIGPVVIVLIAIYLLRRSGGQSGPLFRIEMINTQPSVLGANPWMVMPQQTAAPGPTSGAVSSGSFIPEPEPAETYEPHLPDGVISYEEELKLREEQEQRQSEELVRQLFENNMRLRKEIEGLPEAVLQEAAV